MLTAKSENGRYLEQVRIFGSLRLMQAYISGRTVRGSPATYGATQGAQCGVRCKRVFDRNGLPNG